MWGAIASLSPQSAQAQIQRSFINPGFEQPAYGNGTGCYVQVKPGDVPGWETTHGSVKSGTGNCTGYVSPGSVPLIEIWTTSFLGVNTATTPTSAGRQFAELNAEQNSQLYQNICLYKNETVNFSLLHRGRGSSTVPDVTNFLIGLSTAPTQTVFGTFSTTNNGTVTTQPVAQNGAIIPSVTNNNAVNGWVRYTGTVPYTGNNGVQPVGFSAVSTGSNNNTIGNFLDDVQFAGKPVVEFTSSSGGGAESETNPISNPPKFRIVGIVPAGGVSIPISTSGTAILGTDFNTTSGTSNFSFTIPAGNYDGSDATSLFTIPFTVISNSIAQGDRTIAFTIQPSSNFFSSSTMTCGGSATIASTYTIYDDDFLSGKVWNDADNSANNTFSTINTGTEAGTNAGGLLNAILVDANGNVLKSVPVAADGTYVFLDVPLNQNNVKILLSTTAGILKDPAPAPSLPPNWVSTSPLVTAAFNTGTSIANRDFGIRLPVPLSPSLLLVKRITAINGDSTQNPNDGTPLNSFVDDTTSPKQLEDNNPNWVAGSLKGAIDGGKVKTGDEIEYTIYFLSAGNAPAKNVNFCDLVPSNTTFLPNSFTAGKGIQLSVGSTLTTLSNVPDGDRGEYFVPNSTPPINCSGTNTNGAVTVKVVDGVLELPNATSPGTPNDSYGFVRFRAKAK